MRQQIAWCLAVILGAFTVAVLIGGVMSVAPGFVPVALFAWVWFAGDLTFESELARILGA